MLRCIYLPPPTPKPSPSTSLALTESHLVEALRKCNEIEGYIQGSPYCLYQRRIVAVTLEGLEEPMAGEVEQEYRTRERAEEQKTTVVQVFKA